MPRGGGVRGGHAHPQVMILTTHQSQKVEWVSLLNKMELMLCLTMGIMSILLMMSMELWR